PVTLPSDPPGIAEPHDVLAAEEFAMPAPRGGAHVSDPQPDLGSRRAMRVLGTLALLATLLLRRRRT
ncbi:MAG: hypothetical protein WAU75_10165, partial [Solirubrobacteraceae bacterium]